MVNGTGLIGPSLPPAGPPVSGTARYRALTADSDTDVVIQALLTLNVLQVPDTASTVQTARASHQARGVQFVADRILNPPPTGLTATTATRTPEEVAALERGRTIYTETCFTCHGDDGRGTPDPGATGSTVAPSLAGSPRLLGHRDYVVKAILHGLEGPIDGRTYSQVMVPLGANRDEWVADVASYVRNSFGNTGTLVTTADVARVRAVTTGRESMWTVDELLASLPRPLVPDTRWAVTASHEGQPELRRDNPAGGFNFEIRAEGALSFLGWTTGVSQAPGMWLQVELPEPVSLVELQFTSSPTGGGRGGPPPDSMHPRGYRVQVSDDGTTWSEPIAQGAGMPGVTTVTFPAVTTKFVRITQTADVADAPPWFMRMLRLYAAPAP